MGQIFIRRIISTTERQQDGTSEESSSPSAIDRQTMGLVTALKRVQAHKAKEASLTSVSKNRECFML